jgi:DNA-binding cell septation regulator SpoVG
MTKFSEVKVWPFKDPKGKTRARVQFTYNEAVKLKANLVEGSNGLFIGFPGEVGKEKDSEGRTPYYPYIKFLNREDTDELLELVKKEFGVEGKPEKSDKPRPSVKSNIPNIPF